MKSEVATGILIPAVDYKGNVAFVGMWVDLFGFSSIRNDNLLL